MNLTINPPTGLNITDFWLSNYPVDIGLPGFKPNYETPLGKVFHNLIPLGLRKMVGAYFTNSQAGDLLALLAIRSKDAKVIDPACGSGTLLVS